MTDFESPSTPELGHVGALPTPDSLVEEQPDQPDPFAASMDKAATAMTGEQTAPPAEQDKPLDAALVEPGMPPQDSQAEEPKHKLRVNGEDREVTQSELLELASKGADYTRKTQELARERDRIAALDALAKRLEVDPGFRDHVFGYQQAPAPAQQADQPPADPVERLKWEAVQQAKAEIMREIAPLAEQIPEMQAMQRIESTKALVRQDPAARQVIEAMHAYVNAQPAPFRERVFRELDTNPDVFLSVYEDFRGRLADIAAKRGGTPQSAAPAAVTPQQQPKQPAPSPALESSGNVAPVRTPDEASIRALRKQIKDGTAGPDALGKLLKMSGAFDRMGA